MRPEQMKAGKDLEPVHGEIDTEVVPILEVGADRIGVSAAESGEQAALKQELAEAKVKLEEVSIQIRKLEAAARAPRTEKEEAELSGKLTKARDQAEKAWGGDQEMVTRLLDATKKAFMEGREGIGERLERLRQRAADLVEEQKLIEGKLGGSSDRPS